MVISGHMALRLLHVSNEQDALSGRREKVPLCAVARGVVANAVSASVQKALVKSSRRWQGSMAIHCHIWTIGHMRQYYGRMWS